MGFDQLPIGTALAASGRASSHRITGSISWVTCRRKRSRPAVDPALRISMGDIWVRFGPAGRA